MNMTCKYILIIALSLFMNSVFAKRVALVMGNDNYQYVSRLAKAKNDADAMAKELKESGFSVQLHKDVNYKNMVKAVEVFLNSIDGGDEVLLPEVLASDPNISASLARPKVEPKVEVNAELKVKVQVQV
jgi:hypothetical protein